MGTYDHFKTDENIENSEGITLDYGKAGKFKIHRAGGANQRFRNYAQAKFKPYTRQIQQGTLDDDVANELNADIFAKTVVIGWEGVTGKDGQDLPFTVDNCKQLLIDLPDLFVDIQKAAQDASLFRKQMIEEVVGN